VRRGGADITRADYRNFVSSHYFDPFKLRIPSCNHEGLDIKRRQARNVYSSKA